MKRTLMVILLTFAAGAILNLAGCAKEENRPSGNSENGDDGDPVENFDPEGTWWVGEYDDTYQGHPVQLTWYLDFFTKDSGEYTLNCVVAGHDMGSYTTPFTYVFEGCEGAINDGNDTTAIHYDSVSNTIAMRMFCILNSDTVGGLTTFCLHGQEPDAPTNQAMHDSRHGGWIRPGTDRAGMRLRLLQLVGKVERAID